MDSLAIGVIGCGSIAQHAHLPSILRIPQYVLKAVSDPYEDVARRVATSAGLPESAGFSDYRALLDDPSIDAVCVCAPTTLHAEIAVAALQCGKHTLVEKPMAVDSSEAGTMIDAAASAKRTLMVAYNHTYDPAATEFHRMLDEGELGEILYGEAFFYEDLYAWTAGALAHTIRAENQKSFWPKYDTRFENLREFIHNFGSHVLNLMRVLLGDPKGIDFARADVSETFTAVFDYETYPVVFKNVRIKQALFEKGIEVCGTKKRVRIDLAPPLQRYTPGRLTVVDVERQATHIPAFNWIWPFEAEHRHFVDCILNNRTPLTNGAMASGDVRLAEDLSRRAAG